MTERSHTSTSNFGVGRREAHDASAFYARFAAPEVSPDRHVAPPRPVANPFVCGDARSMSALEDGSVALVVTSPPYFAGKQYEEELDREGVPSSYLEYLALLREVFAECKRTLEPGGRIAVNVANLGRKPYRSLSADVIRILQDDLNLLLRGEVIWRKGEGASGSCAWGSFRSAGNPVLRDLTERVIVASKGRFDRALSARERARRSLPSQSSMTTDEFMAATLDVWEIAPERATRVGHPAPFPVELPERLIHLYTYRDDLVVDPFMGSGSTLVAAARTGRRYAGWDLDPEYVEIARARVGSVVPQVESAAIETGQGAGDIAERTLVDAGFAIAGRNVRQRGLGMAVDIVARDRAGTDWYFDVCGGFTSTATGLARLETVWRALGRAHVLAARQRQPFVLLTSQLPRSGTDGDRALRAPGSGAIFDVVLLLHPDGQARLERYAAGGQDAKPLAGFWTTAEVGAAGAGPSETSQPR